MSATAVPAIPAPRYELFSGIDLTSNSVFGYIGAVWAFGRDVSEPGLRAKALTGFGIYDYTATLAGVAGPVAFNGDVTLGHALLGYQWRRGEWTLKAYAGLTLEDHRIAPDDPANSVNGFEAGAAGQLELWRNLGSASWLSLNASYADVFDSYWTQAHLGHRFSERLGAGIEAGALGNAEYDSARGGVFLRYRLGRSEITLSGGVTGDYLTQETSGYAAVSFYGKF